jgi:hypothetical protein
VKPNGVEKRTLKFGDQEILEIDHQMPVASHQNGGVHPGELAFEGDDFERFAQPSSELYVQWKAEQCSHLDSND